jgi:hypothetical protein
MNAADLERELHSFALTAPGPELATALRRRAARLAPLMPAPELDAVVARVLARTGGLGPLDALLADPDVTDVLLNAGREVWVERHGRLEQVISGCPTVPQSCSSSGWSRRWACGRTGRIRWSMRACPTAPACTPWCRP